MKMKELINKVKEKMTVDEVLKLVEQIIETGDCSPAEALEKVQKARKETSN